jgi:hypothetical protein
VWILERKYELMIPPEHCPGKPVHPPGAAPRKVRS